MRAAGSVSNRPGAVTQVLCAGGGQSQLLGHMAGAAWYHGHTLAQATALRANIPASQHLHSIDERGELETRRMARSLWATRQHPVSEEEDRSGTPCGQRAAWVPVALPASPQLRPSRPRLPKMPASW